MRQGNSITNEQNKNLNINLRMSSLPGKKCIGSILLLFIVW